MNDFYKTLREKLPCHVAQPETYNLLENATTGIQEKKDILMHKLEGLKKGIEEIDKIYFKCSSPEKTSLSPLM